MNSNLQKFGNIVNDIAKKPIIFCAFKPRKFCYPNVKTNYCLNDERCQFCSSIKIIQNIISWKTETSTFQVTEQEKDLSWYSAYEKTHKSLVIQSEIHISILEGHREIKTWKFQFSSKELRRFVHELGEEEFMDRK